jgi:hypothetical protein
MVTILFAVKLIITLYIYLLHRNQTHVCYVAVQNPSIHIHNMMHNIKIKIIIHDFGISCINFLICHDKAIAHYSDSLNILNEDMCITFDKLGPTSIFCTSYATSKLHSK